MKKSIIKMSTLGLSTLLVACGGGGGGAANAPADNAAQPINPQVQALPQTQSQTPPKKSEKTETAPKAEANVSADNKKNPTEPTVQVSSSQPLAVSEPPKAENQPNVEEPVQSQDRNKRDVAEMNKPRTNVWTGRCETKDFCTVGGNGKTALVYKLSNFEDKKFSTVEKTKGTEQELVLTLNNIDDVKNNTKSKNSGENYSFYLLGGDDGDFYFGYRQRANSEGSGIQYDLLYSINNDVINDNIPANYSAQYSKNNGFIYAPLSFSKASDNQQKRTGNVNLTYTEGKVEGKVYNPNEQTNAIFNITGNGTSLVVESTEDIVGSGSAISPKQKGTINVHFIDSSKGANDHKYLLGSGKSDGGSNQTGWVGVLFAEKK
ncbi:hypothetical protein [Pasteurella sp. PK-2025]|uniref:hypothetical protein n=1 Tax=Pasteurella sp. PK-2025 TaxID=3413133 RepID=UPI003C738305